MTTRTKSRRERGDGTVRQLPSGRWQARFRFPDGERRKAPETFATKIDAEGWLRVQRRAIARGEWQVPEPESAATSPSPERVTLATYAEGWLAAREIKPSTRKEYDALLRSWILPTLGDVRLPDLTATRVRSWHASLDASKPTRRAHAYSLLRSICLTAVADDLMAASPCRIRTAGRVARTEHEPRVLDLAELDALVAAMPERWRSLVLVAAFGGLRFGELTELRAKDVELDAGAVRVRRAVTRVGSAFVVGTPKSAAGRRTVTLPAHVVDALAADVADLDPESLIWPSTGDPDRHLTGSTFQVPWQRACAEVGLDDVHVHDLRHTGATLAAMTGAGLKDLQARMGHSTVQAAMRYQHAAQAQQEKIRAGLDAMVTAHRSGNVVPLRRGA